MTTMVHFGHWSLLNGRGVYYHATLFVLFGTGSVLSCVEKLEVGRGKHFSSTTCHLSLFLTESYCHLYASGLRGSFLSVHRPRQLNAGKHAEGGSSSHATIMVLRAKRILQRRLSHGKWILAECYRCQ